MGLDSNKNTSIEIDESLQSKPFLGKGEMADLVQSMDWSKTPLGPIKKWPQSLLTTVSLCLASNFPISISWGPDRVQIYNDGYWPICGDKHPKSMGQDFKECWLSAWPVIGEAFEQASAGETRFLENQRMFLDRYGYLEEAFFTFSFSPILDESGGVGGLFHPVTELTQQSLAERRLDILRTLADNTVEAKSVEETFVLLKKTLKNFELDLPFVLFYKFIEDGRSAILVRGTDFEKDEEVESEGRPLETWPLQEVYVSGQMKEVDKVEKYLGPIISCGPYPERPHKAILLPLMLSGSAQPYGVMVAGVSSRRKLDEPYKLFYDLLKGAVINALTKAKALEEEREKAKALEKLDQAKTAFFSNISHEFRTPLTLILGPLEDSLGDNSSPLPEVHSQRLELVQKNTIRLQQLVNNLLDFSQIESGRLKASYKPTDICAYTNDLASVFRSAMEKAGLQYAINCQAVDEPVFLDHEMWEKVVSNLLSNALKFTFEGKIELRVKSDKEFVFLEVSDTGEGIPKEEMPNLFKRFYRIQSTKSRTHEGSGIGLAFVQELVKLHGGSINAESELNKGTTFTVRIPMGSSHLPKEQIVSDETHSTKIPSSPNVFISESLQWLPDRNETEISKNELGESQIYSAEAKILVVDDNKDMLEYVSRILSKNSQWEVETASNGLRALDVLEKKIPDVVLSDIMMPEMDGFQLLKQLKNDPKTSHIPVIFLSARAGEEATVEGLEKGADDYLIKPFSARELTARVRTQIEITHTRQDNSKLREAEEELKKFKIISDYAFDAFILMQEDGSFAYLNDLALKRWGYTREEAQNLRVPDVDPIYQEDKFNEIFALAQKQGAIPTFETIHKRKDGSTFPVELSMGGLTLDGKPHMFAVARDITGRKLAEQTLKTRNEQLQKINNDLDNFIYTASHDLKAPISNIEGLINSLPETVSDVTKNQEDFQQMLEMIHTSIDRFKTTIYDLTDISRVQKNISEDDTDIDVCEIIEDIRSSLNKEIKDKDAIINLDIESCPTIHYSKRNFKSILFNLLSNALKYSSPHRQVMVDIHTSQIKDYVVLHVRDNGLGIDPSKIDQIFGMFKRMHAHVEGSGIGLYIVKRMVENNGGKIEVESEVGKGTTFKVYFPALKLA